MKKQHRFGVLIALLLCISLAAPCLSGYARAAEPERCSLELNYAPEGSPLNGVRFRIYRVADVDRETLRCKLCEDYEKYTFLNNSDTTWAQRASTLANYVDPDGLTPDAQAVTGRDGQVRFENLIPGLYLIIGDTSVRGSRQYRPTPNLLSLPYLEDDGSWEFNLSMDAKFTYTTIGSSTTQRHVLKVWEDEGNEEQRPESVTVQLLRNGAPYATAVLSAQNNWRHDWTNLPAYDDWQLTELDLGEDYYVTITPNGTSFVVTNAFQEDIDDPDDPPLIDKPDIPDDNPGGEVDIGDDNPPLADLPQTGLLWWPVPLMALLGAFLLCFGCVQHRKGARDEEE